MMKKKQEVLGADELFMIITKNSREKRSCEMLRDKREGGGESGQKQHHQTSIS
jgi:hypothetical protein